MFRRVFVFIMLYMSPAGWVGAATWTVPGDFPNLGTAYYFAEAGDTIIVLPGHYSGEDWTDLFFSEKPVRIVGRDGPGATILDGLDRDIGLHFRNLPDYRMVFEGFTITNCVGQYIGAVNFHENSSVVFRNCIIQNSRATEQNLPVPGEGGGMRIWGASPVVEDVVISNCHAQQGGGVNILVNSSPVFRRVRIENCSGAAMMASENTNPLFEDCAFVNNTEAYYSHTAGVGVFINSRGRFVRCLIQGNSSLTGHSGGIFIGDSTTVFEHCMIVDNTAQGHGGGILVHNGGAPLFSYCTIAGNAAGDDGDGIAVFMNSTAVFSNSIIWQPGGEYYLETGGTITFTNCNISRSVPGTDNYFDHPRFTGEGDYHLLPDSPCRDRGQHAGERIDIDLDWTTDPDEIWDVGADEIFSPESGDIVVTIDMPSHMFLPGQRCYLDINIDNTGSGIYNAILVLVLDAYGDIFFWPSWDRFWDRDFIRIPAGSSIQPILPVFFWPDNTGAADGLFFHTGIMDTAMTELLSNVDSFGFGWSI
jgi:hypothetical protein